MLSLQTLWFDSDKGLFDPFRNYYNYLNIRQTTKSAQALFTQYRLLSLDLNLQVQFSLMP